MSAFGPQPAPPLIPPSSPLSFNLISSNSTFVVTGVTPGPANPRHAIGLSKRLAQPWESRPRALSPYPTGLRGAARGAPAPWPRPPLRGKTPRGLPHPQRPACGVEGSRGPVGHLHSPFPTANLSVLISLPLQKGHPDTPSPGTARRKRSSCPPASHRPLGRCPRPCQLAKAPRPPLWLAHSLPLRARRL